MKKYTIVLLLLSAVLFGFAFRQGTDYKKLHFDAIVVDTHNDVAQRILSGEDISVRTRNGHSDLLRFNEGGLDVEMFSIWVPPEKITPSYYRQANEQIDSIESFARRNPRQVSMAYTASEAENTVKQKKLAAMLGLEGGHHIENDLKKLDHFYKRGVRYMTLTWNNSTRWATSAKDETDPDIHLKQKGLTKLGKSVVRRMNKLGIMVDISHVGERTFWDVIKTTTKPVIASHSSAWALCRHRRNLKDDQLQAIKKNGGVVFINFAPWFIDSTFGAKEEALQARYKARIDSFKAAFKGDAFLEDVGVAEMLKEEYKSIRPPLSLLIDHFDYVAKRIGVDHVGIGSDFDGITNPPTDMDDVTFLPNITRELLKRGYSEKDVRKILGGNFLRVLKEVEKK